MDAILTFSVCNNNFAINSDAVSEIIVPKDITRIPKSPGFVAGVTNVRGEIIGVIDTAKRLSLAGSTKIGSPDTRIVVSKAKDERIGILVDKVEGIMPVGDTKIESLEKYNFCKARLTLNNKNIIILDIDDILNFSK